MIPRFLLPALLLLPAMAPQDDLDARLRALVANLGGEDIVAVDDAQIEILKIGTPALAFLQARLPSLSDDVKLRVQNLIRRIERANKASAVMGAPALVTLRGERPVREHLEELKRLSGQPIDIGDVGEAKVDLDLRDVPHWAALEEICRRHGKICWRFGEAAVRVLPGAHRARPMVIRDQFVFVVDQISVNQTHYGAASHGNVVLSASLAWTRSCKPGTVQMEVASFLDDKGTNLVTDGGGMGFIMSSSDGAADRPHGAIRQPLMFQSQVMPAEGAARFDLIKGRITARFVLETKKLASLESPLREGLHQAEVGERGRFTVRSLRQSGRSISGQAELTQTYEGNASAAVDYVLAAKDGATVRLQARATSTSTSISPSGRTMTQQLELSGTLPEGFEIASIDLISPSDSEEIEIPFVFKSIELE